MNTLAPHRFGLLRGAAACAALLLSVSTLGCRTSESDAGGGGEHSGDDELHAMDASGDQVCADDPAAMPPPEMDLVALDVNPGPDVTVTFNGDTEAWAAMETEQIPFSLQFFLFNGTYIEIFFDEVDHIKVADNRATVNDWYWSGDMLMLEISGFDVDQVERVRASTFIYRFGEYSGSCDDEIVIEL